MFRRGGISQVGQVIGQDSVPAFRVLLVQFPQHLDQVLLLGLPGADRRLQPLVIPLLGEPQHPTRHRGRHPQRCLFGGKLLDERVHL